ncbi:hypothetical protein JXA12_00310 [Candidatus Woesearchaeota archaeon]|nr:hypothetical protein [Candidatus Woesearchaeota archaeon]
MFEPPKLRYAVLSCVVSALGFFLLLCCLFLPGQLPPGPWGFFSFFFLLGGGLAGLHALRTLPYDRACAAVGMVLGLGPFVVGLAWLWLRA